MYSYFKNKYEAGKVIVALNKNIVCPGSLDGYVSYLLGGIDFKKAEIIFRPVKTKNESNMGDIIAIYLKHNGELLIITAIEKLLANPDVVHAEPCYLFNEHIVPNDPYFRLLWGAETVKSTLAWDYTTGSAGIVVGVLDSGIDYNHPDIKNNMWVSQNSYVNGWNFFDNNNNPMDSSGHGTHVAGTIGAVGDNFIGVTGICWNIQIASLRIGDILFGLDAAIAAINFANKHRIPILNNSWGGRSYSPILKFAIEQYDGLFIASAGNYGANNDYFPEYPATFDNDNIISVAATNPDTLAPFSNYGMKSVDIAAPGTDILSLSLHGGYSYQSGSSMSTPYVAGAAALLKTYMPDLTALEIKSIILSSADRRPYLVGKILTGGILDLNAMFQTANRFTAQQRTV